MTTEPFFTMACGGLIAFLFGLVLCFAGYRFFLFLLPIWGFFFGLVLGAQTMQAVFGTGFLANVTSWVVGFVVGAVFAVLAYLFWIVAVAIIAGSLGYAATIALLTAIGLPVGFLVWLIAIAAAIALAFVTIYFNLQKWVVIIATALMGTGVVIGTFVLLFNPAAELMKNPVMAAMKTSPLLTILALALAAAGIVVQHHSGRNYTMATYNRWEDADVPVM
jgi:hypothetical protein